MSGGYAGVFFRGKMDEGGGAKGEDSEGGECREEAGESVNGGRRKGQGCGSESG